MGSPLANLLLFVGLGLLAAALFWPQAGLVPRLLSRRPERRRVRLEDALKQIYQLDWHGQTPTLASLGGALGLAPARVVALVDRMQKARLVRFADGRVLLTHDGRRYALQIIRAHRLWERYLADETGVDPRRWHAEAERREHTLSPDQADALAERLGNPAFDPHGDPIPTADGVVPEQEVVTLAGLDEGDRARVVHVEDEPEVVYAELVAQGIYLGMELQVEEKSDRRIVFDADGRSVALAPLVATNVTIKRLEPHEGAAPTASHTLADLRPGELARVVRINPACRGIERRRLMDLGIVGGTWIGFLRRGMTGGLSAYRVRGTVIALREEQARMIELEAPSSAVAAADGARGVAP